MTNANDGLIDRDKLEHRGQGHPMMADSIRYFHSPVANPVPPVERYSRLHSTVDLIARQAGQAFELVLFGRAVLGQCRSLSAS
jgi:hypothetical protein